MTTELPLLISIVSAVISMLAMIAAFGAIAVNRLNVEDTIAASVAIGARTSRATVISANRQRWIDAIREDVSEIIAIRLAYDLIAQDYTGVAVSDIALNKERREAKSRTTMLYKRVEMRLNPSEDDHVLLLKALESFDGLPNEEHQREVAQRTMAILSAEWRRLKREAAGTGDVTVSVI